MVNSVDPSLLTVVGSVLGTLIGGYFMVRANRDKARADIQSTLNGGFEILTKELARYDDKVQRQTEKIEKQAAEIMELREQIRICREHIEDLEELMTRHNIGIPPRPYKH